MIDKQKHRDIRKLVDQILWEEWDPIGVNASVEARDEYDSYVGSVCAQLWEGKSKEEILNYLFWAENECMGLRGDRSAIDRKNIVVVDKIIQMFNLIK